MNPSVDQLALEYGWSPESGNDPLIHIDALLHAMSVELATIDLMLGIRVEGTRTTGDRATRIRVLLNELGNYRAAARAAAEVR